MPLSSASETLVRRWLDRPENRAEWDRLRDALSLAEGFQFFALQVSDPVAEHFLEILLKGEAGDSGFELTGFDLSRPPEDGPIVGALLRTLEVAPRPSWFFLRGGSMFRDEQPAPGELFLFLNQKRDIIAQAADAPFLVSLPPEGWSIFRQAAPDFWSIHTSVYRFGGAEVRREERVREASEEAFVWQTFAEFVALRLLRAVLPPRSRRKQGWPPPARDGLIGRESEKKNLRTWLAQPGARILLQGLGGIGKTSLLRDVMFMPRDYPDGILFFSLRDSGGVQRIMEDVVETLRPGLLAPLLRKNVLQAMFRDITAEKRLLLVLDDAEDLEVLKDLAPSAPSAVLAASRTGPPPDGWRGLSLDVLGLRESMELLQQVSPGLPPAVARSLSSEARGHPLLLQVLGSLASAAPKGLELWIESSKTRKLMRDPPTDLRMIDASVLDLAPDWQEAWGAAAVFQASFETKRFQSVARLTSFELARERLEGLASRRLLDPSEEGSWCMHPLLRQAALQSLGKEAAESLLRKHATYHLQLLAGKKDQWKDFLPDVEEALRWLEANHKDLAPGEFGDFLGNAGMKQPRNYFRHLTGRWAGLWLDTIARVAAEHGDGALVARARGWSALACIQEGNGDGARERFASARALARESGRPDLEATVLRDQAAFAFWTGHTEETASLAQETLRLSPEGRVRGDLSILSILAVAPLEGELEVLQINELASLAEGAESSVSPALRLLVGSTLIGRFTEDRDLKRAHSDLATALEAAANPAGDLGVQAWALALRGELYFRQKDWRAAQESAESAVSQAHSAYDWEAEAEALRVLGQTQEAMGEAQGAESSYRRLLELREQLYSANHEGVAWATYDLARVMVLKDHFDEAEDLYRRAADIFHDGRPRTERALAATLYELGRLLLMMGRISEAETFLREALAASLNSLGPAHLLSVRILAMLAHQAQVAGKLDEAEELIRSTLALQERSEVANTPVGRHVLGQHLSLLAGVLAESGQVTESLSVLQDRQLPIFEKLGDIRGRAVTLGQIAHLLASLQRYEEALTLLHEELALFQELGDVRRRAIVLGRIAELFAAQERYGEALPPLREQLAILESLGDRQAAEEVRKTFQDYEEKAG